MSFWMLLLSGFLELDVKLAWIPENHSRRQTRSSLLSSCAWARGKRGSVDTWFNWLDCVKRRPITLLVINHFATKKFETVHMIGPFSLESAQSNHVSVEPLFLVPKAQPAKRFERLWGRKWWRARSLNLQYYCFLLISCRSRIGRCGICFWKHRWRLRQRQ